MYKEHNGTLLEAQICLHLEISFFSHSWTHKLRLENGPNRVSDYSFEYKNQKIKIVYMSKKKHNF